MRAHLRNQLLANLPSVRTYQNYVDHFSTSIYRFFPERNIYYADSCYLLSKPTKFRRVGCFSDPKPSRKKEYVGLCSQNVPVTSLLFGDDLQQQLNNIKASNKISQTSANANKSQRSGYKGNSSDSGKNRSLDQYYKRPFHSQSHWRNRGDKSKNSKFPLYKKKGGGGKN